MAFPRITAAILVFLLIGSVVLAGIGGINWLASFARGNYVEHDNGKIIQIGPGMDFVLKTASGQDVHFQCSERCHNLLSHMQRHLNEHASTDVYYITEANHTLLAIDVD